MISTAFANLANVTRRDLNKSQTTSTFFNKNFNRDKVQDWLASPDKNEKNLREVVRFLFVSSSHFRRAVMYFATLPTFKYSVEQYGVIDFESIDDKTVLRKYLEAVNYLDVMNIEHEFSKISLVCWLEDAFFGYEYRLKDSYMIQQLNPDYCQICGSEDGIFTFQFNFQYFDSRLTELDNYDPEFRAKYEIYKKDSTQRWQLLNSEKTICLKINENFDFCVPPLSGVLTSLYEIEDYKDLKKSKTELENYLLLGLTIPYKEGKDTTENDFALSLDKAIEYYEMIASQLPEQVGALLSPFKSIEAIKVDKSEKNTNSVEEAENAFYNDAGISKMLFNATGNGASLVKSIEIDENIIFKFLKQCERLVNRKLKDHCKKVLFKTHFLEMTYLSVDKYIKNVKESAMLGMVNKARYASAVGLSPSAMIHNAYLERVLGIPDTWKPLSSSYTQSSKDNTNPSKDVVSESGQRTRDNESNNADNRA